MHKEGEHHDQGKKKDVTFKEEMKNLLSKL